MSTSDFTMKISLNVLKHLGINLYSNTPSVLAEVIANSWDAGATRVDITYDGNEGTFAISDNGIGMTQAELNSQYLNVGYRRREQGQEVPRDRKPMGRKGIGKLSLFSIAKKIHVQSKKDGKENAFLMDYEEIETQIGMEQPEATKPYNPSRVDYIDNLNTYKTGTTVILSGLRKNITKATINGLRKRIARRFSIIGNDFKIYLDGQEITYLDRDYFDKARFLFQYGEKDVSEHCNKLDIDKGKKIIFNREGAFNEEGKEDSEGKYGIRGWIAIAHHSHDLDKGTGQQDDNLNNIVIVVRGKVAQEDILHQIRMGSLVTKYIYGEIEADFLDNDEEEDMSTSSRQKFIEDDPRYQALKNFIDNELSAIRTKTDRLKEKKGVEKVLKYHPKIKEWYEELESSMKKKADKLFGGIEKIDDVSEKYRATLYVNAIIALEHLKTDHALDSLNDIDPNHLHQLLKIFKDVDAIEAAHYYEILRSRLSKIKKFQGIIDDDKKEVVIQKYIFRSLWLLDPAWERATSEAELEKSVQKVIDDVREKEPKKVKNFRIDIQYRKVSGGHVIIELKRASRVLKKVELEAQINPYIEAVRKKLSNTGKGNESVEAIAIVGKPLRGWDDERTKKKDINALKEYDIKVLTYDELIHNAFSAYGKFIAKHEEVGELRKLIEEIRDIAEDQDDSAE